MATSDLLQISVDQLRDETANVEKILDLHREIDPWCSTPDWVLATHLAFAPWAEHQVLTNSDRSGYALLSHRTNELDQRVITSLEPMWGFACPIIAEDPLRFTQQLSDYIAKEDNWDVVALTGLPLPTSKGGYTVDVVRSLANLGSVRAGTGITRQVANISPESGGFDGWLARRSNKFRKNIVRLDASAKDVGVSITDISDHPTLIDRLFAVELKSWKGLEGSGITAPEMKSLYDHLAQTLQPQNRLRAHVAQLDGHDIGYILGGTRSSAYRGLQLSYDQDVSHLSIGHLLQLRQLRQLCDEEFERYDLGMDFEYKQRWADRPEPSVVVVLDRVAA